MIKVSEKLANLLFMLDDELNSCECNSHNSVIKELTGFSKSELKLMMSVNEIFEACDAVCLNDELHVIYKLVKIVNFTTELIQSELVKVDEAKCMCNNTNAMIECSC